MSKSEFKATRLNIKAFVSDVLIHYGHIEEANQLASEQIGVGLWKNNSKKIGQMVKIIPKFVLEQLDAQLEDINPII